MRVTDLGTFKSRAAEQRDGFHLIVSASHWRTILELAVIASVILASTLLAAAVSLTNL